MPIREPGVIVYITGQQLPPPNPPTRLGYAGYVFASNGPFKTRAVLNSVFPSPFEGIVSGHVYNDISFLRTVAPLYGQLLPNLGHKACSALISYEDNSSTNDVSNLILQPGSSKLKAEFVPMFALPLWLNGAPKRISYYTGTGTINSPSNGIALHNSTIQVTVNGLTRTYIPEILNQNPSVTINDIMEAHAVIHGTVPRPNSNTNSIDNNFSFIIWFHNNDNWPEQNNYLYIQYDKDTSMFHIYTYFDYVPTTPINSISIHLVPSAGSPIIDISAISHEITFTSIGITDITNRIVKFSAVYFSSVNSTIATSINDAPAGSPNPYVLEVALGSDTTNYELSYSPLDTGYYGFIYDNRIEMITTNNIYDHVTGPTSSSDADVIKVAHTGIMATGYFTDMPFFVPQHDLRWHYTRFTSLSGLSLFSPLPDEGGAANTNPQYSNDNNYVYLKKYTTRTNAANLYEVWINAWNNSVLYNESDVRPIKESPIQADLLTDYGGTISYGFTRFIRGTISLCSKYLGVATLHECA